MLGLPMGGRGDIGLPPLRIGMFGGAATMMLGRGAAGATGASATGAGAGAATAAGGGSAGTGLGAGAGFAAAAAGAGADFAGAGALAGAFGGDLAEGALLLVTGRVAALVRVALGLAAVLAAGLDFGTGFAAWGAGLATGFGAGLPVAALTGFDGVDFAVAFGAGRAGAALRATGFADALAAGFRAVTAARLGAGRGAAFADALAGLALAAGFFTGDGAFLARADGDLLRGDVAMSDETPATQGGGSRTR